VAPHTEAAPDPRATELKELVAKAVNAQMRALMHVPAFQELEAGWRGVDFLVRRVETGARLKIFLIDVTKAELASDLKQAENLADAGLVRVLEELQDAGGWSLLAGNYTFGPEVGDVALLARLGRIGQALNAPFVAGAAPALAGTTSTVETPDPRDWAEPPETWQAIRKHPAATHLALLLPRFLARLPYGAETSPCERFPFEEVESPPANQDYLWCNAAFLCACLIAEAFSEAGWDLRPQAHQNLSRLPLHTYKEDGAFANKPCAETAMSERMAGALGERGITAVASIRDSDEVRLVRLQSIADPVARLHGRW
jgi:type VI secretion system protein ImpC